MEIIFEGLFELFGEFLLGFIVELIGSAFGSLFSRATPAPPASPKAHSPFATDAPADAPAPTPAKPYSPLSRLVFYLAVSAVMGGLSLLVFPHSFTRNLDTRLAVLVGTPIACALLMAAIGTFKRKRGRMTRTLESFTFGLAFALPMALIRFFWTT